MTCNFSPYRSKMGEIPALSVFTSSFHLGLKLLSCFPPMLSPAVLSFFLFGLSATYMSRVMNGVTCYASNDAESFSLQAGRRAPQLAELDHSHDPYPGLGLDGMPDTRFLIVAIHTLGLANRLRALASAVQVSQDSNRRLILHWGKSEGCGAHFEE